MTGYKIHYGEYGYNYCVNQNGVVGMNMIM